MAANPIKYEDNFHEAIYKVFSEWKKDPSLEYIILMYGMYPSPWASIKKPGRELNIPLPLNPGAYKDWRTWFSDYLEDQVALVAEEASVKVYVKTNKGNLLDIKRKEPIEIEIEV